MKCVQNGLKKCDYSTYMIYVQGMDLNKLGQMLGLGNMDFPVEDAIFLMEKAKDFLRLRLGFNGDPMLNLISRCVGNLICVLGTSCNYQFEIMSLKSSLAIMMV